MTWNMEYENDRKALDPSVSEEYFHQKAVPHKQERKGQHLNSVLNKKHHTILLNE